MAITLYELSNAYHVIQNMVDEDNTDEDIINALATIEGQIEVKAVGIANLIKSFEWENQIIKEEEKRLEKRRKSRENTIDRVKEYLKSTMEELGMDSVKSPIRTITIAKNPPSVRIMNIDEIPGKFLTLIPENYIPDKKMIADALKKGEEVPGTQLLQGRSLRIK